MTRKQWDELFARVNDMPVEELEKIILDSARKADVLQTNADRIRAMDDVGLAAWYCHDRDCRGCEFGASDGCHLLDWLKAPLEVEGK